MIDKSIRQHYEIQGGKRKRFLHGAMGASATPGATSGGGGGGEGPQGPPSIISRPAPVVTTAVAPPSILARDAPTIPTVEAPPGEKFGPGYVSPEDLQKQEFRKIIAQGQEEKYGDTADPTKFGETISDIDRVMSKPEDERTIEDKLTIEDWEKDQDWDKIKELADRGESFEDIQAAMNKGLLLKEDAIRRQGLIERGLAALKPTTKLESSLLGSLKKTFDPRRLATNFALKKLGLSWLNPLAGLASLFFPKQTAAVKSRFGLGKKQPVDMSAFNQLGLLADRQPTQYAKARDAYEAPISTQIAKGTGLESGQELLGLKGIEGHRADITMPMSGLVNYEQFKENITDWPKLGLKEQFEKEGLTTPKQQEQFFDVFEKALREKSRGLKKQTPTISTEDIQKAMDQGLIMRSAEGGRIDKPLAGRSRDI